MWVPVVRRRSYAPSGCRSAPFCGLCNNIAKEGRLHSFGLVVLDAAERCSRRRSWRQRKNCWTKEGRKRRWLEKKSGLLEDVREYEQALVELKEKLKQPPRHIEWKDLPEAEKFNRLLTGRKRLLDTVRMIAYRAETAMVPLLMNNAVDSSQARTILQTLFTTEADILPDPQYGRLRVRVHRAAYPPTDRHRERLFTFLNETQTRYPGIPFKWSTNSSVPACFSTAFTSSNRSAGRKQTDYRTRNEQLLHLWILSEWGYDSVPGIQRGLESIYCTAGPLLSSSRSTGARTRFRNFSIAHQYAEVSAQPASLWEPSRTTNSFGWAAA
jgi:hypothetical protein